jgi:hypothetical protein
MGENVNLVSPQIFVEEIDQTAFNTEVVGPVGAIILRNTWKGREQDTVLVSNETELISQFGEPTTYEACYHDMFSAIGFLKDANNLYCTRVMPDSSTFAGTFANIGVSGTFTPMTSANAYELGTGAGQIADPDNLADEVACTDPYVMTIIARDRGYYGNHIRVAVCDKTHYDQIRSKTITGWATYSTIFSVDSPLDSNKEFLVLVQECKQGTDTTVESNWKFVESWNVSTETNKYDDLGRSMFVDNRINDSSEYIRVVLNATYNNTELITFASAAWQTLGGGCNTTTAGQAANADEAVTTTNLQTAIDLYGNAESINLDVLIDSGKDNAVKLKLAQVANARKDCMAILDCPKISVVNNVGSEETDLVTWITTLYSSYSDFDSSYVAAYGNWLDIRDKYAHRYRWVPSSGYVAGIYVRCQNIAEAWFAPAVLNRAAINNVRRLAWNPTLVQRDAMYKYGINPIVSFAGQGKFIWGQKTLLDKDSAFNRVNVRRLFLSLEKDTSAIARYYLYEPNNSITRQKFVSDITPIYEKAKGKDGIEDFKIVCDETNNTTTRIARGEMLADIWIKPVYAAEYIRLTFIATKAGVDFTEA